MRLLVKIITTCLLFFALVGAIMLMFLQKQEQHAYNMWKTAEMRAQRASRKGKGEPETDETQEETFTDETKQIENQNDKEQVLQTAGVSGSDSGAGNATSDSTGIEPSKQVDGSSGRQTAKRSADSSKSGR